MGILLVCGVVSDYQIRSRSHRSNGYRIIQVARVRFIVFVRAAKHYRAVNLDWRFCLNDYWWENIDYRIKRSSIFLVN